MKVDQDLPPVNRNILVNCFQQLYSPNSSSEARKQADQHLISLEKNPVALLVSLIELFEEKTDRLLSFQALVYFVNVVKRNWTLRRYNKEHANFEMAKKAIRQKLLNLVISSQQIYMATLFDAIKFIVKNDYPHNYPQFSQIIVQIARQVMEVGVSLSEAIVVMMKYLREIIQEVGERKGHISRKIYDENVREVLNSVGTISIHFRTLIEGNIGSLSSNLCKISKYSDQMLISLLRAAPPEIQDEQQTKDIMNFLQQKLESLVSIHTSASKQEKAYLEKNIKSLIYEQGCLQNSKPLILGWTLPRLYEVLFYVITNHQNFIKTGCIRYSLIGIRRIFKQFTYYADESLFGHSAKSKQLSANALELRRQCNHFYNQNITPSVIQNLLNFLLQNPYARTSHSCLDLDENILEKGQQKELNAEQCVVWLIQGMLERFTELTEQLIRGLINNCLQSNWSNLNQTIIGNLLSVVAVLPSTHKKRQTQLQSFPILEVLEQVFKTPAYKPKFAPIVSGWLDCFQASQISAMTEVLLSFMEQEANIVRQQDDLNVLIGCCQCLNKMILQRTRQLNLQTVVQRAVPVSILVLGRVDNPQVLWPMVNLISNVITRVQLRSDILMKSLQGGNLSLLIQNDSEMLVQALCDMLKGFLCVIPRQMPAQPVYELVCAFLNNHLSKFHQISHQKIFYLWYVAIRQYSPIHNCDRQYIELFYNHFRKNLFRKTATLIYILEEYLLSGLIPGEVQQFVDIIIQCYTEAGEQDRDECDKLKIASLSFQITLISKYDLEQVNSNQMLQLILTDFCSFNEQQVSPTLRNSLLSILNRYLIRFSAAFFHHLESINLPFPIFLEAYLKNMQFLTSHTAIKINAIAILSILNSVDTSLMLPHITFIIKVTLPQVQNYNKLMRTGANRAMTGTVDNSPNLRFGSNVLSQRKEAVRKEDYFQTINLCDLFRNQILTFLQRVNSSPQELSAALQGDLGPRLLTLL